MGESHGMALGELSTDRIVSFGTGPAVDRCHHSGALHIAIIANRNNTSAMTATMAMILMVLISRMPESIARMPVLATSMPDLAASKPLFAVSNSVISGCSCDLLSLAP